MKGSSVAFARFAREEFVREKTKQEKEREKEELRKWYAIRDMLFGFNHEPQNISKALELAHACEHQDSIFLRTALADLNEEEEGTDEMKIRFLSLGENDPRGLCFAALIDSSDTYMDDQSFEYLDKARKMGYLFADVMFVILQLRESDDASEAEAAEVLKRAAAAGERDALLDCACLMSEDAESDIRKRLLKQACELGVKDAYLLYAECFQESEAERYYWLGKAAASTGDKSFMVEFRTQINMYLGRKRGSDVMFAIGHALHGQINEPERTIFQKHFRGSTAGTAMIPPSKYWFGLAYSDFIGPAKQAVDFYETQVSACRKAVNTWILVGIRKKVVKDVRKIIGEMIWKSRFEALYKFEEKPIVMSKRAKTVFSATKQNTRKW